MAADVEKKAPPQIPQGETVDMAPGPRPQPAGSLDSTCDVAPAPPPSETCDFSMGDSTPAQAPGGTVSTRAPAAQVVDGTCDFDANTNAIPINQTRDFDANTNAVPHNQTCDFDANTNAVPVN